MIWKEERVDWVKVAQMLAQDEEVLKRHYDGWAGKYPHATRDTQGTSP